MSDDANRSGHVSATPEGGPIDAGAPASSPGAGQVRATPEAAPLDDDRALAPPTWQEHMAGPVPGVDVAGDVVSTDWKGVATSSVDAAAPPPAAEEPPKQAPYVGKPVSSPAWDAMRYAAPIVSQAEKLAISAIGLSGRGLSKLAQYLEARRVERGEGSRRSDGGDR